MRSVHCVSLVLVLSYSIIACTSGDDSGSPAGSGGNGGAVGVSGASGSGAAAGSGDAAGASGADSDTSAAGVSGAAADTSNPDASAGSSGDGNSTAQGGGSGGAPTCTADLTCPTFANTAPVIHDECVVAAVPVGKGGPMPADGLYFRTKSQIYTGASCSSATARQETVQLKCGVVQFVNEGEPPTAATPTLSGSELKLTIVCPKAGVLDFNYDSTATTFTLYDGAKVHTYTRQ